MKQDIYRFYLKINGLKFMPHYSKNADRFHLNLFIITIKSKQKCKFIKFTMRISLSHRFTNAIS